MSLRAEAQVPTAHGSFRFLAYKDRITGTDHIAVVSGDLSDQAPLVRVHSECLTGEAFGSLKCECGPQLDSALDAIEKEGGIVIYMRGHEGRGIGLAMVRHLVHANGGTVRYARPVGAGARFILTF